LEVRAAELLFGLTTATSHSSAGLLFQNRWCRGLNRTPPPLNHSRVPESVERIPKMQEAQTWRTVLADILKRPGERQRIAVALGINPVTLTRWAQRQSDPRPRYLHQLLTILSEEKTALRSLLAQEFPEVTLGASAADEAPQEIDADFYAEVLQLLASSDPTPNTWSVRKRILEHALEQLDPGRRCITIALLQCVPPSAAHQVRSVRVLMGVGLPSWGGDVDQQLVLFGAESMTGRVVSTGQPVTIANLHETRLLAPPPIPGLRSLSVYPLQRAGRIAGTFNVVSSEPGYLFPSRNTLIQQYSNLVALTFAPEDYYALEDIHLCLMPPPRLQVPFLTRFRARLLEVLTEAASTQQSMTNEHAEQRVWQRIEEELVHAVFSTEG
jgi:hypothetical protein